MNEKEIFKLIWEVFQEELLETALYNYCYEDCGGCIMMECPPNYDKFFDKAFKGLCEKYEIPIKAIDCGKIQNADDARNEIAVLQNEKCAVVVKNQSELFYHDDAKEIADLLTKLWTDEKMQHFTLIPFIKDLEDIDIWADAKKFSVDDDDECNHLIFCTFEEVNNYLDEHSELGNIDVIKKDFENVMSGVSKKKKTPVRIKHPIRDLFLKYLQDENAYKLHPIAGENVARSLVCSLNYDELRDILVKHGLDEIIFNCNDIKTLCEIYDEVNKGTTPQAAKLRKTNRAPAYAIREYICFLRDSGMGTNDHGETLVSLAEGRAKNIIII